MPRPSLSTLFQILDLAPSATPEEVKRSYRRLLLIYHPDKNEGNDDPARVIALTEAYRVLSDPVLREQYEFTRPEPEQGEEKQRNPTRTISLEEFTFHPRPISPDSSHRQDTEHGDTEGYYTHPCRCSGQYTISLHELEQGVDVVGCEGCGEWVGVGYEVVEEEEE